MSLEVANRRYTFAVASLEDVSLRIRLKREKIRDEEEQLQELLSARTSWQNTVDAAQLELNLAVLAEVNK